MSIITSTPVSSAAAPVQGQAVQAAQALPAGAGLQSSGGAGGAMGATTATPASMGTQGGAGLSGTGGSLATVATAAASSAGVSSAAASSTAASSAATAAPAPFAQWLGQQADSTADAPQPQPQFPPQLSQQLPPTAGLPAAFTAALPTAATAQAGTAAPATAPAAADGTPAGAADQDKDNGTDATHDNTLLAAMAMPLMPLTPMQIAQAVQIAQGGMNAAGSAGGAASADGRTAAAAQSGLAAIGVPTAGQDGARRADIALPQLAKQPAPATQPAPVAATGQPLRQDDAGVRLAVQTAATNGGATSAAAADAASQDGNAATQNTTPATPALTIANAAAAAQPGADSVKLAGPPAAWRQSLQEALGDRLHVQVGKNVEQAVIRLDPPQLGRIDIAIRHSNGTLEVNISATHGEVLRQLQAVGDNLRNDLAQRQYVDVAVSVTPAPKGGSAAPFGDPNQQQGRGRQPGRDQDNEQHAPGRALAEAGSTASAFSLGGREA